MGQKPSYVRQLRECLYANNRAKLKELMNSPDFISDKLNDDIFTDLVLKGIDAPTVMQFARIANDDQLALLASLVILQSPVVPLADVFALMQDVERTVKKHHLSELFMTACDRGDDEAVRTMLKYKCYDPQDGRPLLIVCRRELDKVSPADSAVLKMILDSLPGHAPEATYILEEFVPAAKSEANRSLIEKLLVAYTA